MRRVKATLFMFFCLFFAFGLLCIIQNAKAENSNKITTVWVDDTASMTVDGDLTDWESLNAPVYKIDQFNTGLRSTIADDEVDLSAVLQCFADRHYLYVAVTVTDETLVFGESSFGKLYNDDCIQFYFDGDRRNVTAKIFDENDGQILVTLDDQGNTFIEGRTPIVLQLVPYTWQAVGIRSSLRQNAKGYIVELAIPYRALGWKGIQSGKTMGMNLRVFDDDDGGDFDSVLEWAIDKDVTKIYTCTDGYKEVVFTEKAMLPKSQTGRGITSGELEAAPEPSDYNQAYNALYSSFKSLALRRPGEGVKQLSSAGNPMWALPFLGTLQRHAGDNAGAIKTFRLLIESTPGNYVSQWAFDNLASLLSRTGDQEAAAMLYEKMIEESKTPFSRTRILIQLGNLYCRNKDYKQAAGVCERLLESEPTAEAPPMILSLMEDVSDGLSGTGQTKSEDRYFVEKFRQYVHYCKNVIDKYPNSAYAEKALEMIDYSFFRLIKAGEIDHIIAHMESFLQSDAGKDEKDRMRIDMARIYFFSKNYEKAQQVSKELLNSDISQKYKDKVESILYDVAVETALMDSTSTYGKSLEEKERYTSNVIVDAKWGNAPEEMGMMDRSIGIGDFRDDQVKTYCCPTSFDVGKNGTIYVLDSVNNKVKTFDQKGALLSCLPVNDAGIERSYIVLDKYDNIWLQNQKNLSFCQYTSNGKLMQTIRYDTSQPVPLGFCIDSAEIRFINSKIEVIKSVSKTSSQRAPVREGQLKELESNELSLITGSKSKRTYTRSQDRFSPETGLLKQKMLITEKNGDKHEFTFNDVDPLYLMYFMDEDVEGNIYFACYYHKNLKPRLILKYSPDLKFLAKIELPVIRNFIINKREVFDEKGQIFVLNPTESGFQIIKWSKDKS